MIDRFYRVHPFHVRLFSSSPSLYIKKKMPPKKASVAEKKTLLGRPSNNLKIGIVGLFRFTFSSFSSNDI
jgi:obg-like ATPase 1